MSNDVAIAVRTAEEMRCAAMVANDAAALDSLLDPRLQFSHATGLVDDKAAYLAKLAAGRIRYIAIAWSDDIVTPLAPNAALLTGRMTTNVRVEGVDKTLENRVTTAWSNDSGAWRMVAFQSTPIKA